MQKQNRTNGNEKSVLGGIQNASGRNQFDALGGNSNGLSVFNYAENASKVQCDLCRPAAYKSNKQVKLCPPCQTAQEERASELAHALTTPPKVVRLGCRCFSCNRGLTPARMAAGSVICRTCASDLKSKGATAQNLFVEKVKANVGRFLREVSAI